MECGLGTWKPFHRQIIIYEDKYYLNVEGTVELLLQQDQVDFAALVNRYNFVSLVYFYRLCTN